MAGDASDDAELLLATARGDADAFAVLVRRHIRAATLLAAQLLGDQDDAEDTVQVAFTIIAIGIWHERTHARGDASGEAVVIRMDHEHVVQMLGQALKLDSTQHQAILATLHRHQLQVDSAWGTLRPHVNATLDSTHAEIMNLLRPEQRAAFQQMMVHGHAGGHRH